MNFIQMVNEVARESGTMGGNTLPSVQVASGRWVKLAAWVRQAWEMIQRERSDWTFMQREGDVTLEAGKARYSAAELLIADYGGWLRESECLTPYSIYDPLIGRKDELRLPVQDYRRWRDTWDIGVHDAQRPCVVAIDHERRLCFGPTPDQEYVVRLPYRRAIQSLVDDADVPFIADDYHAAIVWRALMLLGDDDEAPIETASSGANYYRIREAMIREYTEPVTL